MNQQDDHKRCLEASATRGVRENIKTLLLREYQGLVIYREVEGGQRVYNFKAPRSGDDSANRWLMLLGARFAFSGLFSFFKEFRLRKI